MHNNNHWRISSYLAPNKNVQSPYGASCYYLNMLGSLSTGVQGEQFHAYINDHVVMSLDA